MRTFLWTVLYILAFPVIILVRGGKALFLFIRRKRHKDLFLAQSGEDFELGVCQLLYKNGFKEIETTKASNDYGVDILAKKQGKRYAFQCKFYQKPVGPAAVQEVAAGAVFYECENAIVVTNSSFTKNAVKLAESSGVTLWDKSDIERMR